MQKIVNSFVCEEIISTNPADFSFDAFEPFQAGTVHSELHLKDFRKQLVQHNLLLF